MVYTHSASMRFTRKPTLTVHTNPYLPFYGTTVVPASGSKISHFVTHALLASYSRYSLQHNHTMNLTVHCTTNSIQCHLPASVSILLYSTLVNWLLNTKFLKSSSILLPLKQNAQTREPHYGIWPIFLQHHQYQKCIQYCRNAYNIVISYLLPNTHTHTHV